MVKNKGELRLPSEYSLELAEETGIHIGDGNLGCNKSVGKVQWIYGVHLNVIDDKEYVDYVNKLMFGLYNLKPYLKRQGNCISLIYTRRNLVLFKERLGLPIGDKSLIRIPSWVIVNKEYCKGVVRGIFDTDGCIRFTKRKFKSSYPELKITSKSIFLIEQIKQILDDLNIVCNIYRDRGGTVRKPNDTWHVVVKGRIYVPNFFDLIGSSNLKHIRKYEEWRRGDLNPQFLRNPVK